MAVPVRKIPESERLYRNSGPTVFIDHAKIETYLREMAPPEKAEVRAILQHARELKGLDFAEAEKLLLTEDPDLLQEIFDTAYFVKEEIYGKRLVLFAPLYISNLCKNECAYCAFRASNKSIKRRALSYNEIAQEVTFLENQGHKRILLVAGEAYPREGLDYVLKAIDVVYATKSGKGEIRRVNVNVAPLTVEEFRRLKERKIGTYQIFQETYHYPTYLKMHARGPKRDYKYRLLAIDRAFEAGIDDVGIGVLFGLYNYRFEILALLQHIRHLETTFGMGPHTISVPRLEPAEGSSVAANPPFPVSDQDFKKIMAVLRVTVPYTGMILSTRENPEMRRAAFRLGVSQISAGSRTNPGGYTEGDLGEQFSLGDHRPIDEVIYDCIQQGMVPSFCTGCYRLGRTGQDFMDLAKPGLIKIHCLPNALTTFKEYLEDYASPRTREAGLALIRRMLNEIPNTKRQKKTEEYLHRIEAGERDLYF